MARKRKLMTSFFDEENNETNILSEEAKGTAAKEKEESISYEIDEKTETVIEDMEQEEDTENYPTDKEIDELKKETDLKNNDSNNDSNEPKLEVTKNNSESKDPDETNRNENLEKSTSDNIIRENSEKKPDLIQNLIEQKKKRDSKRLVGIYFDEDIADVLDEVGELGGRGAKSKTVNDVVRVFLENQGLL